jgi:lipoprotein-anchoring transpeptidase ErfK/SrfK
MYISRQPVYNIIINTKEHTLSLYLDNEFYKIYPVAVGRKTKPSPKGTFKIANKSRNPGGPYGARWMGLSIPHYGIHGTNDPTSIGKDISGGCIRMQNKDVIELYNLVPIGTVVQII